MIDYVIVIYKNYDLLDLQAQNFKKRLNNYNLIVVDNTPDNEKRVIKEQDYPFKVIPLDSKPTFDGVSHGRAIDFGLQHCTSGIVGILDSDFFILNNNIHNYVYEKFEQGYKAVGCEYNDGKDTSYWVNLDPVKFKNIPCCFGAYYDLSLAKSATWVVTEEDVATNRSTGFVEVGSKVRKYILQNQIKTLSWKNDAEEYGSGFFRNEKNEVMGMHYVAGSHRRWNFQTKEQLQSIIGKEYD
jgi:hypothetical protein